MRRRCPLIPTHYTARTGRRKEREGKGSHPQQLRHHPRAKHAACARAPAPSSPLPRPTRRPHRRLHLLPHNLPLHHPLPLAPPLRATQPALIPLLRARHPPPNPLSRSFRSPRSGAAAAVCSYHGAAAYPRGCGDKSSGFVRAADVAVLGACGAVGWDECGCAGGGGVGG